MRVHWSATPSMDLGNQAHPLLLSSGFSSAVKALPAGTCTWCM